MAGNSARADGAMQGDEECRGCLERRPKHRLRPLDAPLFKFCTSLEVEHGAMLCEECCESLAISARFKQHCIRADDELRRRRPVASRDSSSDGLLVEDTFSLTKKYDTEPQENIACDEFFTVKVADENIDSTRDRSSNFAKGLQKRPKKTDSKKTSSMLYCQKCDKSFYKYIKLEAHMRKHFGMKPDYIIHCDRCDKKFANEKNLKSHLRVHSGERKYKCSTCGKSFAYLNVLKNHERAHAGIKKYVCHQCGKKFVQLSNLNTHMLLHTGEKPYLCEPCNRRFGQPSEYKLHMLRHTGVKNFACNLCSLRFYTNANLQKHMGVHSDVRPYACKLCDKQFKTRSYMAIHNRTHTGERPFSCDYCSMKFMSGKDKRNHHKTHTGEKLSTKTRKSKTNNDHQNSEQVIELNQSDQQQIVLNEQSLNNENQIIDIIHSNPNTFLPQQDIINSSNKVIRSNFICDNPKSIQKPVPNTFYQIPIPNKTQCSYTNTMY